MCIHSIVSCEAVSASCPSQCPRAQGDADAQEAPARQSPPRGFCPCRDLRVPAPSVGMPLPTLLSQPTERVEVEDATTQPETGGCHPGPGGGSWRGFRCTGTCCASRSLAARGCSGVSGAMQPNPGRCRSQDRTGRSIVGGGAAAQLNACHRVSFLRIGEGCEAEERERMTRQESRKRPPRDASSPRKPRSPPRARAVHTGCQVHDAKGWDVIGSGFVSVGFYSSNFLEP